MKSYKYLLRQFVLFVALSLFPYNMVFAQSQNTSGASSQPAQAEQVQNAPLNEARLAQLLAPIALYPDPLLMQMFVAATYPLEIVEAARFMREHSDLKNDALDKVLEDKKWDVSVKSLCHFPTVLDTMNKNLETTKELGDSFLKNQKAVMDMIQELRAKAKEKGNLKSTEEQKVIEKDNTIVIEPAKPDVIYVPSYSCSYVYGPWWYPAYPPYVWYPPPPAFRFVAGVAVGAALSHGWYHANWARGRVDVNINRNINVNRRPRGNVNRQAWRHNPQHRRGVAYNNPQVRKRYGQVDRAAMKKNLASRGYTPRMNQQTRNAIKKQRVNRPARQGTRNVQPRPNRNVSRPHRTTTPRSSSFNVSGSRARTYRSSNRGSASRSYSRARSAPRMRSGGARGGRRR
jgi:hypothetical protein